MLVFAGCATAPGASRAGIDVFTAAYADGWEREDVDAIFAVMTDDFVALPPGRPPIADRAALRADIEQNLAAMEVHALAFAHDEVVATGDWAWVRGRSRATVSIDGARQELRGSYLWILRRGADGAWRIARDCATVDEGGG